MRAEEYAYYVNKLRQNVGLENEYDVKLWRHKERTPNATEWTPHAKFLRTPLLQDAKSDFSLNYFTVE